MSIHPISLNSNYLVNEENERLVRDLCYGLSDEVVRYNDFTSEQLRRSYTDADFAYHRLEITWTDVYADKFEVAQLDSGFWYYSKSYLSENEVIAFGLTYIDEILGEYNLILPDTFHLPLFEPEFIEDR